MDSGPNPLKRSSSAVDDNSPASKKLKQQVESPAHYSDAVRKKLAATSRTGQACDRCKERKMKCDTDPIACTPCRSKNLRCFTTDRVTGQARERGQSDRAEGELLYLREQVQAYHARYGPMRPEEATSSRKSSEQPSLNVPSSRYVGWPAPANIEPLCKGPINGTKVDILDGIIDVADFDCEVMREPPRGQPVFNVSRTAIVSTIFGYQRVNDPGLPSKHDAVSSVESFLVVMSQYYPVVHRPSFRRLVERFYDEPGTVTIPERVQVMLVLAVMHQQMAVRNHANSVDNFEKSHRYLHYALGFYRDVYHDVSLPSMQALSLIVLYFRNLPKPGSSWSFSHQVLVRTIELQYHRDPESVVLPAGERTVLARELRKRVFHAVLGVCVTTGCRVGSPAPWQFSHMDVPLPAQITDDEIDTDAISAQCSGRCDFHPALHLSRHIPLLTELYNNILSVRRSAPEYLKTVEALNTKILAWRQDWDESLKVEATPRHTNLEVASLLMDQWTAEFQMMLHHPSCCPSKDPQIIDRQLEACHKSAKRLLSAFHNLNNKYKGVDFTWHSTAPYALAFGITLHYYRQRLTQLTKEQFEAMLNEIKGWMTCMAYADVVLKTGNHLQHLFKPRAQGLENEYRKMMPETQAPRTNSFASINGATPTSRRASIPNIKPEPSPQRTSQALPNGGSLGASVAFSAPQPPTPAFSSSGTTANTPATWPIPQYGSGQGMQTYSPYSQASSSSMPHEQQQQQQQQQQSNPQQHYSQHIPVSLAPLLNETSGMYHSYATVSQAQTQTTGPPMADYTLMPFSPNHYYDNTGPMSWPLISLPPGQHQ